jgi:NAD-dependent dihydropyrimidine dehydrogenase PreA subunit
VGTIIFIVITIVLAAFILLWLFGEHWRLLRRSTWTAVKSGGLPSLLKFRTLHFYIYERWGRPYIRVVRRFILPFTKHWSAKWKKRLADHHHAKVLTPELAQAIISNSREIPLHDLEQIVPYSMARSLVLNAPADVAAYECTCRHTRRDPCQPTLVCMVIGQPFVDFVLEHNPRSSRRLTQAEALELLRSEHERGHIHTAWFKDVLLDRLYAICNCCKCCCGGIEAMLEYGIPTLASSGYVARVDEESCTTCANCQEVCPFGGIHVEEIAVVNWENCMGCGACISQCPGEAISLERDEKKGVPLDVRLITQV